MRDNMHDWVVANKRVAKALAAKGYHYQFVFARNAAHVDRAGETTDAFRSAAVHLAGLHGFDGQSLIRTSRIR